MVTTRSRARTEQWTEQDRVREQAHQWVEAANAQQNAETRTEESASGNQAMLESTGASSREMEPDILDLAGIQITMSLEQLLRLVPRFREGICRTLEGTPMTTTAAAVQLTEVDHRIMDSYARVWKPSEPGKESQAF
jgi:hypothetical protein